MHSIIDSGENFPLQIAMEVHINHVYPTLRYMYVAELIAFMNYLRVFGGYYLVNRRDNEDCSHCSEIVVAMLDCEQQEKKKALSKDPMTELKYSMKYNKLFEESVSKFLRKRTQELGIRRP